MYLIPIAWMYVVVMMAVAEATSSQGTLLGALVTFVLYGLLPLSIVMYLMGTPGRRRTRLARERAEAQSAQGPSGNGGDASTASDPDRRGHAAGDSVAAEGKEP
jgi:hypothetical protein